jgi:small subunit ribosomal protein S6
LPEYIHDPRSYELMVLISPELSDEALAAEIDTVSNVVTGSGAEVRDLKSTTPWGRRRLAYPIQKHNDATYVLYEIACQPEQITEFERELKLDVNVIRYLLVRAEEEEPEVDEDEVAEDESAETDAAEETEETVEAEA